MQSYYFCIRKIRKRKDYEEYCYSIKRHAFHGSMRKGNEEMKEAKVVVSVYDENGKIATGVPVKMYNEKDYKVFEKII